MTHNSNSSNTSGGYNAGDNHSGNQRGYRRPSTAAAAEPLRENLDSYYYDPWHGVVVDTTKHNTRWVNLATSPVHSAKSPPVPSSSSFSFSPSPPVQASRRAATALPYVDLAAEARLRRWQQQQRRELQSIKEQHQQHQQSKLSDEDGFDYDCHRDEILKHDDGYPTRPLRASPAAASVYDSHDSLCDVHADNDDDDKDGGGGPAGPPRGSSVRPPAVTAAAASNASANSAALFSGRERPPPPPLPSNQQQRRHPSRRGRGQFNPLSDHHSNGLVSNAGRVDNGGGIGSTGGKDTHRGGGASAAVHRQCNRPSSAALVAYRRGIERVTGLDPADARNRAHYVRKSSGWQEMSHGEEEEEGAGEINRGLRAGPTSNPSPPAPAAAHAGSPPLTLSPPPVFKSVGERLCISSCASATTPMPRQRSPAAAAALRDDESGLSPVLPVTPPPPQRQQPEARGSRPPPAAAAAAVSFTTPIYTHSDNDDDDWDRDEDDGDEDDESDTPEPPIGGGRHPRRPFDPHSGLLGGDPQSRMEAALASRLGVAVGTVTHAPSRVNPAKYRVGNAPPSSSRNCDDGYYSDGEDGEEDERYMSLHSTAAAPRHYWHDAANRSNTSRGRGKVSPGRSFAADSGANSFHRVRTPQPRRSRPTPARSRSPPPPHRHHSRPIRGVADGYDYNNAHDSSSSSSDAKEEDVRAQALLRLLPYAPMLSPLLLEVDHCLRAARLGSLLDMWRAGRRAQAGVLAAVGFSAAEVRVVLWELARMIRATSTMAAVAI